MKVGLGGGDAGIGGLQILRFRSLLNLIQRCLCLLKLRAGSGKIRRAGRLGECGRRGPCTFEGRLGLVDLLVEDGTLPVKQPGRYDIRAPFPEQASE